MLEVWVRVRVNKKRKALKHAAGHSVLLLLAQKLPVVSRLWEKVTRNQSGFH